MSAFHRSSELPLEGSPAEDVTRQEVASWSHYDDTRDETAVVTLSVLLSTRITLTTSGRDDARLAEGGFDGFVGCEWRFLLLPSAVTDTPALRSAPVHTRFCFMGCLPPPTALRGQGGVVFLDSRRTLVVGSVPHDGGDVPAPVLDYYSVQDSRVGVVVSSPQWVRRASAIPLALSLLPRTVYNPLLVTTVGQSQARKSTDVLTVVACASPNPVPAGCDGSASEEPSFDLVATVLRVTAPSGSELPSAQCIYTSSERGLRWPNADSSSSTACLPAGAASPQGWEWIWVPGVAPSTLESAPTHGALVCVSPDAFHDSSRIAPLSSGPSLPLVVCAGPLTAPSPPPLAIGIVTQKHRANVMDGDSTLLAGTHGIDDDDVDYLLGEDITAGGSQEQCTVRLTAIGTPTVRVRDTDGTVQPPALLYWVLDFATSAEVEQSPPLSPGLYLTGITRASVERMRHRSGPLRTHVRLDEPVCDGMSVRVDAACSWSGLHPVDLSRITSLVPQTHCGRVTRASSTTSWTVMGERSCFRCFVGTDSQRTRLHCVYLRLGAGGDVLAKQPAATPLLVCDTSLAPLTQADYVERLVARLFCAAAPSVELNACDFELWAWRTVTAAVHELWRWCFSDVDCDPDTVAVWAAFVRCLDSQLLAHPFTTTSTPSVHGQHLVTLACEDLAGSVDASLVAVARSLWQQRCLVFLSSARALAELLDTMACERHHRELARQLVLLLLGSGTHPEDLRVHLVLQTTSPHWCSERRQALLCLYATSLRSETALELTVSDILYEDATTDGHGDGALMMMEYSLLQALDEALLFDTLQRLWCRDGDSTTTLPSGVLGWTSLRALFLTWEQPHVTDVLTPAGVCLPYFVDCLRDCRATTLADASGGDAMAAAEASWAYWSRLLPDEAPVSLPDFLLREEVTDWSLFPWCAGSLTHVLASWQLLMQRWQRAVQTVDGGRDLTEGDTVAPTWVRQGRRHWPLLTRIADGAEALQRLAAFTYTSHSVLAACLREGAPLLSSWSRMLHVDPPALFTGEGEWLVPAVSVPPWDNSHTVILKRLFQTVASWRVGAPDGSPPPANTPWILVVWEHYVASASDALEAAASAETVLTGLATADNEGLTPWLFFFRACRCVFVSLLPRLLAVAATETSPGGREPPARKRVCPAGEWCQRLIQLVQRNGRRARGVVSQLDLLVELAALQPSIGDIVATAAPASAHVPELAFSFTFPSLYATACVAGNSRAVVTLAEVLRCDMARFVSRCLESWTIAGMGQPRETQDVKALINEYVDLLESHADVLSHSTGSNPLCGPLLHLLFLECVHGVVSGCVSVVPPPTIASFRVAVDRLCEPLGPDERGVLKTALRAPFSSYLVLESGGEIRQPQRREVVLYVAHPFHHLVQQRLFPEVQRVADRCCHRAEVNALLSTTIPTPSITTAALSLVQQEESFVRRRLSSSLASSHAAFLSSTEFRSALQSLYVALRLEGYRRAWLDFATQQKDMCFTLFAAHLYRLHSVFNRDQRAFLLAAAERARISHEGLLHEEKKARAGLEEAGIDGLHRLYRSALDSRGDGMQSHLQPADLVAEAGSAILGTLNRWQKKLADTVAPMPKPAATMPTAAKPHFTVADEPADTADGWEWNSEEDEEWEREAVPLRPQTFAHDPTPSASEPHNASLPLPPSAAGGGASPRSDGWGWSTSEADSADEWDWPDESAAAKTNAETTGQARGDMKNSDEWEWPSRSSASSVSDGGDSLTTSRWLAEAERRRTALLNEIL